MPVITDDSSPELEETFGGGYRRPAVRVASSGDATVPADEEVVLTPEQQQLQMDLENAESMQLCEDGEESTSDEVACEITLQGGGEFSATSTCAEVNIAFVDTRSTTAIEWAATFGSQTVANGVWDAVSENTKVVAFTYVALSEEGSEDGQLTTISCTGTIEGEITNSIATDDCPDGELYISTSADGSIWLLVKNGLTTEDPNAVLAQGPVDFSALTPETPISIAIDYEIEGSSDVQEDSEEDLEYEFSGEFAAGGYYYHQGDSENATFIQITSGGSCEEAPFTLYWYILDGSSWDYSSSDTAWDVDGTCTYTYGDSYTDEYIVEVDSASTINWQATVDFRGSSADEIDGEGEEIDTPFEYTFESASVRYSFELTEVTEVRITANTFMSCEGRNQIVPDPEMALSEGFGSNLDQIAYADNNYSDSDGNCSAAEIYEELESGQYVLDVINADYDNPSERGTITIRSSIELVEVVRDWSQINLRNESVNPPKVFDVTIPEGGALFVATADSSNSDEQCENAGDDDNPLTYVDPYIILINKSTSAMIYSDDDGENIGLPCYSSYLELEVDGGEYLFIATTYALVADDGDYDGGEIAGTYTLEFGVSGSEVPEEVVIEESTEPAPRVEIPAPPALPVGQLVEPGSKGTVQIADGVTSMVCTSTCIDELFAAVDPSVSSLQVAIGKNTVELKRNSKKAVVAVEAGSRSVNVVAVSDTGVETKVLTGQVQIGEPEVMLGANSADSGSSFNWLILVIIGLIVAAGAGVVVSRRNKTV